MSATRPKIIWSDSSYPAEARQFELGWLGPELDDVNRRTVGTYGLFNIAGLPPFMSERQEDYAFYRVLNDSAAIPEDLAHLIDEATKLGLELPSFFVKWFGCKQAREMIDSPTACYFDLGENFSKLPDGSGYVLRFYNDQQGCCYWYLFINEKSEHCVLTTFQLIGDEADDPIESYDEIVFRTSPTFEDFIKRTYIENLIWFSSNGMGGPMRPYMTKYVNQCKLANSESYAILLVMASAWDVPRIRRVSLLRALPKDVLVKLASMLPIV